MLSTWSATEWAENRSLLLPPRRQAASSSRSTVFRLLSRVRDCKYVPVQILLSHPSKTRRHTVKENTPVPLGAAAAADQVVGRRAVCSRRPALRPGHEEGDTANYHCFTITTPLDSFMESRRTRDPQAEATAPGPSHVERLPLGDIKLHVRCAHHWIGGLSRLVLIKGFFF